MNLLGGDKIKPYAPFSRKQINYIKQAQLSWLNVAEGS